jgi:hypothetical protein
MIERQVTAVATAIGPVAIPAGYALVRLDTPATMTTSPNSLTMFVNTRPDGALKASNSAGDFSLSATQNKSYYIDPKYTIGASQVQLIAATTENAKVFILCFERISA